MICAEFDSGFFATLGAPLIPNMRKSLLSLIPLLLLCALSLEVFAQNTCAAPTTIAAIPYNSPTSVFGKHSTCGKVSDYNQDDACGNMYIRSEDYVYKFTAAAGVNCINIDLSGTINIGGNTCPGVFLFDGCPDVSTTNCVSQGINPATGSGTKLVSLKNIAIVPGTTYFVVVAADTGCYTYTLSITKGTCPAAPDTVGQGCADAKVITSLPYVTSGLNFTTCGKGQTYNIGNPCQSYYMDGESFTFKYTSPVDQCATISVNTDSQYGSLYVIENCPTSGNGKCLGSVLGSYNGKMTQFMTFEAGKDYYIVVSSYNAYDNCQKFDISITDIPLTGRTCADAINIPTVPVSMPLQSTRCKGNDYNAAQVNGSQYINGNDVVYKYTSPGGECFAVSLSKINSYTGLYIMDACPSTPGAKVLGSDSAYYTFTPVYGLRSSIDAEAELTTPGTYYIVVANQYPYAGYDTDYDMFVSSTPDTDIGSTCANPYLIDSLNFNGTGYSTSCKGADYVGSTACSDIGSRGNDVVFKITADRDGCAKVISKNISSQAGFYLLDACPSDTTASCLGSALCDNAGCDSVALEYTFEKGKTYYMVVSAAKGASSVNFDVAIRPYELVEDTCQVCSEYVCKACKNIGFDLAILEGWTGFEGIYTNPKQTSVINPGTINSSISRHTVMSAGSYDPIVGTELPVVSPYGGNYAARLGNSQTGAQAEVFSYTYTVDTNTNNFYYYYAVVLQDGGHAAAEQPYFQTNVFVDGSEVITCGYYEVSAAADVPGFQPVKGQFGVNWKNWALVSIPLINYVGREVTIEFTTKDCSQGGHYGYGYIDAFCGKAEILRADKEGKPIKVDGNTGLLCKDSTITMTAPAGYASYAWSNGATGQTIEVNSAGTYDVTVTSVSGCSAIIRTEIKEAKDPEAKFNFEQPCSGTQVGFKDASMSADTFKIKDWSWDFGDGSTATIMNPAHNYSAPGTYTVKLKVKTEANCGDVVTQSITVKPPVDIPPIGAIDSILICTKDSIKLTSNSIPNTTVKWEGPKGFTSTELSPSIPNADTARSGLYIITVKFGDCDNAKDTTVVTVLPMPKYSVSKDTNVCYTYNGIVLKATGGQSYDWSPGYKLDTQQGPKVRTTTDSTTTYLVLISNDICPDSTMKVKVTVDTYVTALVSDHSLSDCTGDTLVAHATADPKKWIEWTNGAGAIVKDSLVFNGIKVAQNGYYKVRSYLGPNRYCQFGIDSVYINANPLPVPVAGPVPNSICYNDSGFASVSGASSYEWKQGATMVSTSDQLRRKPMATTQYDITAKSDSGCIAAISYTIQVKQDFNVSLGPDKIACEGDTLIVSLLNADFDKSQVSFLWSDGSTDSTILTTQSGNYWVRITNSGCTKSDTVKLDFQQPSSFSIGNDQTICSNDSVLIDLSGVNGSVTWTDGFPAPTRYLKDPGGTFGVIVQLGTCLLTDSITITSQHLHSVTIGPDSTLCLGYSYTLQSPYPGEQNSWIDGANSPTTPSYTVSSPGTHNLILFVSIGECLNSDTAVVIIQQPPLFSFGADSLVCENVPVLLKINVPGAYSYLWNNGQTTDTLTAFNAGTYFAEVKSGVCTVNDTIVIKHDMIPVFNLGPDQNLCNGQTATIGTTVAGDKYLWSSGQSTSSISVNSTNDYSLQVSRGKCQFRDTVSAGFQAPPVVFLGTDFTICNKVDTLLYATQPGATYSWNTGSTTDTIHVTGSGTYSVVVNQGPCTSTDNITILVQPMHAVSVPADQILCHGVTVELPATTNATNPSYVWNTGETSPSIDVDSSWNYVVTVSSGVCTNSDSVLMTFVDPPSVDLGNDSVLCMGSTVTLDATYPGSLYTWSTGETTPNITVNTTGTYFVQATIGPCHDEDTVMLTFKTPPLVQLMADAEICEHEKITITGAVPAGLDYQWSNGETTSQITVEETGTYILQVSDLPCVVSDTFNLIVNPIPVIYLKDTVICPTDSAYFDAFCPGCTYDWSTGSTDNAIWSRPGSLADVVVTSDKGCIWKQTVHAFVDKDCPEEIYVPNAFTPNNDGVNDVFKIVTGNVKLHDVIIYDRWGEQLYRFTDPNGGWDGRYLGEVVQQGIYNVRVVYSTIYREKKAMSVRLSVLK